MDFLEDLQIYEEAMQNAYLLITKKQTLDDVYEDFEDNGISKFYLPFDPISEDGRTEDIIDMVIEHFITREEYEKCAELVKIKEKCLKTQTESDQPR
tara:strand:- start:416 stop:706 length:291 start_codon:yes stop_codon:yes gene_type:complete